MARVPLLIPLPSLCGAGLLRLGASAEQICDLYGEHPGFRTLWDDYMVCQLGLKHWTASQAPEARQRRLEYLQTLRDLELEIRKQLASTADPQPATFHEVMEIVRELRDQHGLQAQQTPFAPLFPLIEMAWLASSASDRNAAFIEACGEFICRRQSRQAGDPAGSDGCKSFMNRFLYSQRPPHPLERLSALGLALLRQHGSPARGLAREKLLWHCCYRIASNNPEQQPNQRQWDRLLELAPHRVTCPDFLELAQQDLTTLLAASEAAWQKPQTKENPC